MILNGLVMRSTGSWYIVQTSNKELYNCRLKGVFKIKGIKSNNPIAVGDRVVFDTDGQEEGQGVITIIEDRTNYIIRKSVHKTAHAHILAANVDQCILVATINYPKTSLGFIDRFLVTAESFRIPVTIVFNKIDLLQEEDIEYLAELCELYENLGYKTLYTSCENETNIDTFKNLFNNKVSLISGHSGVGKSTLLNTIDPNLDLATTEISSFANKGVHTTTFATIFEITHNSYVIDSPGIKELGIMDIENTELSHYFPEMRALLNQCKYNNCQHIGEPKCAVIEAIESGTIAESRYKSYLSILEDEDNRR
jgi:ribosome biogenesis GTPase / thiamine phosphate phosphatase